MHHTLDESLALECGVEACALACQLLVSFVESRAVGSRGYLICYLISEQCLTLPAGRCGLVKFKVLQSPHACVDSTGLPRVLAGVGATRQRLRIDSSE